MPVRVLIADDQPLVRSGLRTILSGEDGIEVLGEAADGEEAVAKAQRLGADVVLMDIRMPRLDGLEATRRLVAGGDGAPAVVVLTTFDHDEYLFDALRAGAAGFLLKDAPPERIVEAVRVAASGDGLLAPEVTRRVIADYAARGGTSGPPSGWDELTDREREVFLLVGRGRSNGEIAADLFLSEATVKTHVGRVLLKLGLRDRVQIVVCAYESGLVRPGEGG
jgi:DNA-binding NarL/FixJ family response regulator